MGPESGVQWVCILALEKKKRSPSKCLCEKVTERASVWGSPRAGVCSQRSVGSVSSRFLDFQIAVPPLSGATKWDKCKC